jgi:hypothetical protein
MLTFGLSDLMSDQYGLKSHLMVTKDSQPVEFFLTSGSESDVGRFSDFPFDLPARAQVFVDNG